MPALIALMSKTSGSVMEMGTGIYSTPFLHWACHAKKRELISYEDNREYFRSFQEYQDGFHKIFLVDDFGEIILSKHFDLIFMDHFPQDDRKSQLERLINDANYVLVHDVTPGDLDGIAKYRFDYPASPGASVFSNFMDLRNLEA